MDIAGDKTAYLLSKILGELDSEESGTRFLYQYWNKTGKMRYVQMALGEYVSFGEKETHYPIALEGLCERLVSTLKVFLKNITYSRDDDGEIGQDAVDLSAELISAFEGLGELSLSSYGWEALIGEFSRKVNQIENMINRLQSKEIAPGSLFETNAEAEDFLRADFINYNSKSGKYFVRKR